MFSGHNKVWGGRGNWLSLILFLQKNMEQFSSYELQEWKDPGSMG